MILQFLWSDEGCYLQQTHFMFLYMLKDLEFLQHSGESIQRGAEGKELQGRLYYCPIRASQSSWQEGNQFIVL